MATMTTHRVSGYLAHKLKHEFDLDELRVWEDPMSNTVRFELEVFGERRMFAITTELLISAGEAQGMGYIRDQLRKIIAQISHESIDLRHNAIESVDDLKVLIDREDEFKPRGAVIISKDQADGLIGDDELFKLIIQDQNTGANTLFGHPFRVYTGRDR